MNRRLYFLFPDEPHAQRAVADLEQSGIAARNIHALAKDQDRIKRLPQTTSRQRRDLGHYLEWVAWSGNLGLFGLALLGFIITLVLGEHLWAMTLFIIMAATFIGGFLFTRLPDVGLHAFEDAMAHGEIVLMVDVKRDQIMKVEKLIQQKHPEAAVGGISWSIDAMGL